VLLLRRADPLAADDLAGRVDLEDVVVAILVRVLVDRRRAEVAVARRRGFEM